MKLKQVYRQIASFTGDWKDAMRKAKVFDENCLVPLGDVEPISLSYGHFSYGNHEENRDTLNFLYTDKEGYKYHFCIMD